MQSFNLWMTGNMFPINNLDKLYVDSTFYGMSPFNWTSAEKFFPAASPPPTIAVAPVCDYFSISNQKLVNKVIPIFEHVNCPQQTGKSCSFHAVANAHRLKMTDGKEVISEWEGKQMDNLCRQTEHELNMQRVCGTCFAGRNHLSKYEADGGLYVDTNRPILANSAFVSALKQLKSDGLSSVSCVVYFKTHVVALNISKRENGMVIKVVDSDSRFSIHPNTQNALNLMWDQLQQFF